MLVYVAAESPGICGHACAPRSVYRVCTSCYQRWRKAGFPFAALGQPLVPSPKQADVCMRPGCSNKVPDGRRKFCSIECCNARGPVLDEQECALPDCHERFTLNDFGRHRKYHDPDCKRQAKKIAARKQYRRKTTGTWIY